VKQASKPLSNKREYISKVFSLGKGKTVTAQIKARVIKVQLLVRSRTLCVLLLLIPQTPQLVRATIQVLSSN
jgi:hypothetical protein